MTSKIRIVAQIIFGLAAPLLARAAAPADDVRVDVVVDMTDAGRLASRPTPNRPAFYLPLTVGYQEEGAYVPDQKLPPPTTEIQRLLARALYDQGYQLMTKEGHPSLVLVFWWGYMAPEMNGTQALAPQEATHGLFGNIAVRGQGGTDSLSDPGALVEVIRNQLPTTEFINQAQMISLVSGDTRDYQYPTDKPNPVLEQVMSMARAPRHYVLVSAFDFQDWRNHKATLLWRAHMSTELAGHDLGEVVPAMIAAGAPMFGRETKAPQLISESLGPRGMVIVGDAKVVK